MRKSRAARRPAPSGTPIRTLGTATVNPPLDALGKPTLDDANRLLDLLHGLCLVALRPFLFAGQQALDVTDGRQAVERPVGVAFGGVMAAVGGDRIAQEDADWSWIGGMIDATGEWFMALGLTTLPAVRNAFFGYSFSEPV